MKKFLFKKIIPKLLSKSCRETIPRSGEEGERVNCYIIAIDDNSAPYFVVRDYEEEKLKGLEWDGNSYRIEHEINLDATGNKIIRITHYYGLSTIVYTNIYDFIFNYLTKYTYIKIHIYRFIGSISLYFFNKRKLVTKKRMELLEFMMNDQLDRTHNGIDLLDLMTKLYSIRWVVHPSAPEQQKELELHLDSLVQSGELEKINNEYVVTGKTIQTIEKYEEEERKHTEAVKLQKKMFWLTIFLAILAVVQAGIIKLPTLIDLTK